MKAATLSQRLIPDKKRLIVVSLLIGAAALVALGAWRLADHQSAAEAPAQQPREQAAGGAQPAVDTAEQENIGGGIDRDLRSRLSVEERMRDATAVARVKIAGAEPGRFIDHLGRPTSLEEANRTQREALPYTSLHAQVLTYLKGDLGSDQILLEQMGGTIDGLTWVVSGGAQEVKVGDEAVVFLRCTDLRGCGINEAYIIEGAMARSEGDDRELPVTDLLAEIEAAKAELGIP